MLSFDDLARASVTDALKLTLGAGGFQVLRNQFELERAIPEPLRLHELLANVFRSEGATVIEREIIREIARKTETSFREEGAATYESSLANMKAAYIREASSRGLHD